MDRRSLDEPNLLRSRKIGHDRLVRPAADGAVSMAAMLRRRRQVLQPEEVGFARGRRRRTPGLRREEAAALSSMSTAHYSRLERGCGPRPSPMMVANVARGLRFDRADRDRLFAAAGHDATRCVGVTHLDPGVMLLLGRLADTPTFAVDTAGLVLHQTLSATALFGDFTSSTGWARSCYHRWFAVPSQRRHHPDEHAAISAEIVADLRRSVAGSRPDIAAEGLVHRLLAASPEFGDLWCRASLPDVAIARTVRVVAPQVGVIDLQREVLVAADRSHRVVVYIAEPGSRSDTLLRLLSVVGQHRFRRIQG